jgi:hypothetical protein
MYELTGDKKWEKIAIENTVKLDGIQYLKDTHDLGFMVFSSYGNAYRIGVGNLPGKSEVDVPQTYADYYYLEALKYKYNPK